MTLKELNDIRNPKVTVERIFDALSIDEKRELQKIVINQAYPKYAMRDLWSSLSIDEKRNLIEVIALDTMAKIMREEIHDSE